MKTRTNELKAVLSGALLASCIVSIQFLAVGLVLAKIAHGPVIEARSTAGQAPARQAASDRATLLSKGP